MTLHLTHEQLCDLILDDSSPLEGSNSDVVQAHLRACPVCSAELQSLRDSIAHFRGASSSYARQEFAQSYAQRSSIAPPHSFLTQPLYWTAAAVVFVAALFPLSMNRRHSPVSPVTTSAGSASVQTIESDEALLADIDQKVSADVPSPMEPLADPTAGSGSSTSAADQRKD
jgi:anti-sigma factor RsiW